MRSSCLSWIMPDHIVTSLFFLMVIVSVSATLRSWYQPFLSTAIPLYRHYSPLLASCAQLTRNSYHAVLHARFSTHDWSTPPLSSEWDRDCPIWVRQPPRSTCIIYRMISHLLEVTRRLWKRARRHVTPPPPRTHCCLRERGDIAYTFFRCGLTKSRTEIFLLVWSTEILSNVE
jgi:hypothetical protein